MLSELLLNDLISVERKLERLTEERKRAAPIKPTTNARPPSSNACAVLSDNTPLRKVESPRMRVKSWRALGCLHANRC